MRYKLIVQEQTGDGVNTTCIGESANVGVSIFDQYQKYFNKVGERALKASDEDKAALEAMKTLRKWLNGRPW